MREELTNFVTQQDSKAATGTNGRLFTKDVAALLGITRQTVASYRKRGILPEPCHNPVGKPYWTREQVAKGLRANGLGFKFGL